MVLKRVFYQCLIKEYYFFFPTPKPEDCEFPKLPCFMSYQKFHVPKLPKKGVEQLLGLPCFWIKKYHDENDVLFLFFFKKKQL